MLKVESLSRRYGQRLALDEVSCQAERGEIIALLGRNGAGKSTLMNVLTGYLAMSSGQAWVAGYDVQKEPMAARKQTGYLPEQPPLYPDMTVREYLRYCTELKGVRREKRKSEIERVIELTGLGEYAARLSGRLSKGYRQRLGVAQAMLGSPSVLILDEPGSGLDPLQMMQMRDVVREAGKDCTVLLSSHLLSEVTQVCSRALVLDKGVLCYDGAMNDLLFAGGRLHVAIRGGEGIAEALRALPGVAEVQVCRKDDCLHAELRHEAGCDLRGAVFALAVRLNGELLEMYSETDNLETALVRLLNEKEAGR